MTTTTFQNLTPSQEAVLQSVIDHPRTAEQIAIDTGYARNTVRPRILELRTKGLVKIVGQRRTLSGRQASVYGPTGRAT